jgi:hypothetical protein
MTQYVVTAPCLAHVPFDTPQGKQLGTLYTDAVVPGSVPKELIDFWLDSGMIKPVDGGKAPSASPASKAPDSSGSGGRGELKAPPESGPGSSKEAWVDYAERRGMKRADAEALNKADLIKAVMALPEDPPKGE